MSISRAGILIVLGVTAVFLLELRTLLGMVGIRTDAETYLLVALAVLGIVAIVLFGLHRRGNGGPESSNPSPE